MSLPNYLAKIKSSGVYRYVFDKSEVPASERSSIRLIVGYSEKGPFNTPVYISDASDFIATFGNVSRRMERKGIFFHRLALQALEAGPILALNIKPFNQGDEPEQSSVYAFNASDVNIGYKLVDDYYIICDQTYSALKISDYQKLRSGLCFERKHAGGGRPYAAFKREAGGNFGGEMLTIPTTDELSTVLLTICGTTGVNIGSSIVNHTFAAAIVDNLRAPYKPAAETNVWLLNQGLGASRQVILDASVTAADLGVEEDNILPPYWIKASTLNTSGRDYLILLNTRTGDHYQIYQTTNHIDPSFGIDSYYGLITTDEVTGNDVTNQFGLRKLTFTDKNGEHHFYALYNKTAGVQVGPASEDGTAFFEYNPNHTNVEEVGNYPDKFMFYPIVGIWETETGWTGTDQTNNFIVINKNDECIGFADGYEDVDPDLNITSNVDETILVDFNDAIYNDRTTSVVEIGLSTSNIQFPDMWVGFWPPEESMIQFVGNYVIYDIGESYYKENVYRHIAINNNATPDFITCEALAIEGETIHTQAGKALVANTTNELADKSLSSIYNTNRFWKVDAERLHDISVTWVQNGDIADEDYVRIVNTSSLEDSSTVFIRPYVPSNWNVTISDWYAAETAEEMPPYLEAIKDHYLSEFFVDVYVFGGDMCKKDLFAEGGTLGMYNAAGVWQPFCNVLIDSTTDLPYVVTNPLVVNSYGDAIDVLETMAETSTSNFIGRYTGIMFPNFRDASGTFIDIASVFNSDYETHKLLLHLNEALLDDASDYDLDDNGEYDDGKKPTIHGLPCEDVSSYVHALCSPIFISGDHVLDPDTITYDPAGKAVAGIYMKGYTYYSIQKADKGEDLYKKIINVLNYKGIRDALTNNVDVEYKYIVDTFQGYPGVNMKSEFSTIAKAKFNTLALVNFPPMNDVIKHFGYKAYDGSFDMSVITKRRFELSLPPESQGASWTAFYTQLQMTDGSSKFTVPSAALVSNLYMEKRAKRLPYYIVAGPNYGRISASGVLGPDYNYSRADLDVLEPFGVNAIIYIPRKGTVINSNQTAKQTPVTALSKVHVRELVTFIQDEVEDMLYSYQWELNTSALRDAIRTKAETILGLVQANGGIYDYRVQCDSQNNTPEIIDNEMVVVDLEIEPARGAGKMVQTLTLHRTGGISATPRN